MSSNLAFGLALIVAGVGGAALVLLLSRWCA